MNSNLEKFSRVTEGFLLTSALDLVFYAIATDHNTGGFLT